VSNTGTEGLTWPLARSFRRALAMTVEWPTRRRSNFSSDYDASTWYSFPMSAEKKIELENFEWKQSMMK